MEQIRLRYNHQSGDDISIKWRLSIGEVEILAYKVFFSNVFLETTEEIVVINDEEVKKYCVSCNCYENISFTPTENGWKILVSGHE